MAEATELAAEFPGHVAAEWTGRSQKIAETYYWRVTEADHLKAIGKSAAVSSETEENGAELAV